MLTNITLLTTVDLMSAQWRRDKSVKLWQIPRPCEIFRQKYDLVQEQLQNISCMDDLLSGKLQTKLAIQLSDTKLITSIIH